MARQILHYYIDLPTDQALEVRSQLEATIWEIAQEENVEAVLRESDFRVVVGQPMIELGTVITVIVTYVGMKIVDEAIGWAFDKAVETTSDVWTKVILPKVRERLGRQALVDSTEEMD